MKNVTSIQFLKLFTLLFCISFLTIVNVNAQEKTATEQVQEAPKISISIDNISNETEKLGQRILELRNVLKPSTEIHEVDSLVNIINIEILIKKDSAQSQLENSNKRDFKLLKIEWRNYLSTIKNYQETLKERTENIIEIKDELVAKIEKWKQTKEELSVNSTNTKDLTKSIKNIVTTLQDVLKVTINRLDYLINIQNNLTKLVLVIDELNAEITQFELDKKRDYFTFDSDPLWNVKKDTLALNNAVIIAEKETDIEDGITSIVKENSQQLIDFLTLKKKEFALQLLFILLLITLMITVNKKWKATFNNLSNPIEREVKVVMTHPFSAVSVVGLLISAFFYGGLIPIFREIHVFIVLIGTIILLPKLTTKKIQLFLLLILISYMINLFEAYFGQESIVVRYLEILNASILIVAIYNGKNVVKKSSEKFEHIYSLFLFLVPFYIVLLLIAILTNIIGMVGLSYFLFEGILTSVIFGMVVYLAVKIISSIVVLLFKLKKSTNIQTLSTIVNATHQRIQPILFWVGFFVWILFALMGFGIYELLTSWVNEILLINWKIGEMTISLGGILAFSSIFIITLLLAKLAAAIFQDEWMIKALPRGIAPAISLLLRIIVISIGFYVALSAAGIDLSKIGFILGTLGVGIGFGLQNVVLNFIAGLILAFERPINLGDTIEVGQEKGIVTNIGVRSSNIKTYSGSEAIIPNGDLISKTVINWTLTNRNRRSKILMRTAASANPEKVIELFNSIANEHAKTFKDPAPKTYFYGYNEDGNLSFALIYWTTFSDTLKVDSEIALKIFGKLREEGISAPVPARRIFNDK